MVKRQLKYVLILLRFQGQVLLINREKAPFTGLWNGVGGKIELNELPKPAAIREVKEETGYIIQKSQLVEAGTFVWYENNVYQADILCFLGLLTKVNLASFPKNTREGILAFKDDEWVLDPDNTGIVPDLKSLWPFAIAGDNDTYLTAYNQHQLTVFKKIPKNSTVK